MGRRGLGESELVEDDREGSTPDRLQELATGGNEEAAHELRADDSTADFALCVRDSLCRHLGESRGPGASVGVELAVQHPHPQAGERAFAQAIEFLQDRLGVLGPIVIDLRQNGGGEAR